MSSLKKGTWVYFRDDGREVFGRVIEDGGSHVVIRAGGQDYVRWRWRVRRARLAPVRGVR